MFKNYYLFEIRMQIVIEMVIGFRSVGKSYDNFELNIK